MSNATMEKFGYPASLVAETGLWSVQLRPQQVTLGSLVLVCKEDAGAFGALSRQAFAELGTVIAQIEAMLGAAVAYDKINYLMLMMVDPDVHFHVLPRYDGTRQIGELSVGDAGWPGPPDLGSFEEPDAAATRKLVGFLKDRWPG